MKGLISIFIFSSLYVSCEASFKDLACADLLRSPLSFLGRGSWNRVSDTSDKEKTTISRIYLAGFETGIRPEVTVDFIHDPGMLSPNVFYKLKCLINPNLEGHFLEIGTCKAYEYREGADGEVEFEIKLLDKDILYHPSVFDKKNSIKTKDLA